MDRDTQARYRNLCEEARKKVLERRALSERVARTNASNLLDDLGEFEEFKTVEDTMQWLRNGEGRKDGK